MNDQAFSLNDAIENLTIEQVRANRERNHREGRTGSYVVAILPDGTRAPARIPDVNPGVAVDRADSTIVLFRPADVAAIEFPVPMQPSDEFDAEFTARVEAGVRRQMAAAEAAGFRVVEREG